jgi:uncharacterized protein YkwD
VAHLRRIIPAALGALALCLCLPASAALGAPLAPGPRSAPVAQAAAVVPVAHRAAVAPVARADAFHKHSHGAVRGRRVQCAKTRAKKHAKKSAAHANRSRPRAKRTSFHSTAHRPHHSTRPAGCRGANKRHTTVTHHVSHHPSTHRPVHRSPAAAHSSSCPDADLRPNEQNLERIRVATLCLVNRERTGRGESPLSENAQLEHSAQAHSEDMASGGYFEHVGPHGDTPLSRMRAAGYIFSAKLGYEVGENIAWGTLWLATPRSIVAGWMASSGHRENILDAHFRDTGVGVSPHPLAPLARGQAGAMYTEDFGVIITG